MRHPAASCCYPLADRGALSRHSHRRRRCSRCAHKAVEGRGPTPPSAPPDDYEADPFAASSRSSGSLTQPNISVWKAATGEAQRRRHRQGPSVLEITPLRCAPCPLVYTASHWPCQACGKQSEARVRESHDLPRQVVITGAARLGRRDQPVTGCDRALRWGCKGFPKNSKFDPTRLARRVPVRALCAFRVGGAHGRSRFGRQAL